MACHCAVSRGFARALGGDQSSWRASGLYVWLSVIVSKSKARMQCGANRNCSWFLRPTPALSPTPWLTYFLALTQEGSFKENQSASLHWMEVEFEASRLWFSSVVSWSGWPSPGTPQVTSVRLSGLQNISTSSLELGQVVSVPYS